MRHGSIAVSTSAATAGLVEIACIHFERAGYAATTYPADGVGGPAMEAAIRVGAFVGVLDCTLTELACDRLGTAGGAGPDRLTAAAIRGIPQVVVPGGLDLVTSPKIADALAKEIAEKACAARGATAILLPRIDADDAAMTAFAASLKVWLYGVDLIETEFELHDLAFATLAATTLLKLLAQSENPDRLH